MELLPAVAKVSPPNIFSRRLAKLVLQTNTSTGIGTIFVAPYLVVLTINQSWWAWSATKALSPE